MRRISVSLRNRAGTRARRGGRVAIAALAAALALLGSVGTAHAQPSASGAEGTAGIEKSILFLQITWSGYINYQSQTGYQAAGDVLAANAVLTDAFATDVRPLLAEVREDLGIDPDPIAAYHRSGYFEKISEERAGGGAAGWGA